MSHNSLKFQNNSHNHTHFTIASDNHVSGYNTDGLIVVSNKDPIDQQEIDELTSQYISNENLFSHEKLLHNIDSAPIEIVANVNNSNLNQLDSYDLQDNKPNLNELGQSLPVNSKSDLYSDIYFPPYYGEDTINDRNNVTEQSIVDINNISKSAKSELIEESSNVNLHDDLLVQASTEMLSKLRIVIGGMSCHSCAQRIEKTLSSHKAVDDISVNFASETADIIYNSYEVSETEIIAWVNKEGFSASKHQLRHKARRHDAHNKLLNNDNNQFEYSKKANKDEIKNNNHDIDSVADYFNGTAFGTKNTQVNTCNDTESITDVEDDTVITLANSSINIDMPQSDVNQAEQVDNSAANSLVPDNSAANSLVPDNLVSNNSNNDSRNQIQIADINKSYPIQFLDNILKDSYLSANTLGNQKIDIVNTLSKSKAIIRNSEKSTDENLEQDAPKDFDLDESVLHPWQKSWRLLCLGICAVPFIIGMMGMFVGKNMAWTLPVGIQFIIASFAQFILAHPFYKNAWRSLRSGMASMDVLVVLGSLSTWFYSCAIWFLAYSASGLSGFVDVMMMNSSEILRNIYFETSVMIIAFISFGKFLELSTKKNALNSIDLLVTLMPETVKRQSDIGDFYEVDIDDIQVDDIIKAHQGDRIACDGVIVEGNAWCDESHLTGESRLVAKPQGEMVMAGSMVENGSILYQVSTTVNNSQLADMIEVLSNAQGSKAPIARLADKVAAYFVPAVIVIAMITFGVSFWAVHLSFGNALMHAVAVLVIACPCALGLATPAAIMSGMGVAAKHGVWFKDAQSLEQAGKIDTVVMDKTGTLTEGNPTLVAHLLMDRTLQLSEVLQLAASIETHVNHPLATALVESATQRDIKMLKAKNIQVISGLGVQGEVEGVGLVKVGSLDWVNFPFPENMAEKMHDIWQLASVVAVSIENIPLGAFALADDIRNDAKQTVLSLQTRGIDVVLMSGDKNSIVEHVANRLGIEEAFGNMKPRDKANKILEMQNNGLKVAMVGDGVNDALAMTTADASFAVNGSTDITQQSASVHLLGSSLMQLYDARQIAKATVRNIKQNLFFALVYNCTCIPMAMVGLVSPTLAGLAMAFSSISVLINSLRLKRYSPRT